ncbi:MAG: ABC transporter ATP-binding protein [Proteobacteria bacterium]|nr:ABC transporter ATP-binding protein [Pseudomonadota bacterium]
MIVVDDVAKYYGSHCAVRDLEFTIEEGECVGFLGLNGAGKTTTLRMLSCLLLPTSGRIEVRGLDVVDDSHEIRRLIGYLPDNPPLYAEMSVCEYLKFAGKLRGLSDSRCRQRLDLVLGECNLGGVENTQIASLSHGYRQRVGIAQAIIHDPSLLILDEPIQGLDPVQIVDMRAMIRNLRGRHTILLSTHILSEIEQTCDRILMMHEGRIAAEGSEEQLAERYGAGQGLELEARGAADTLREALDKLACVDHASVRETGEDSVLLATLRVADSEREAVSRAVIEAGLGLLGMRRVTTGLENIFVQLSKGAGSVKDPGSTTPGEVSS